MAVMATFVVGAVMACAVVVAVRAGEVFEVAVEKLLDGLVRFAADAAVERDARFAQRHLRASADAAADQRVHAVEFQKARQRAVTAAHGVHDALRKDLSILDVVQLELGRVAEMLENHAVFVGDCDSHDGFSLRVIWKRGTIGRLRFHAVAPAGDRQTLAVDQTVRDLVPRALVELCDRGAGNAHPLRALRVGEAFVIHQTDRLEFVHAQRDLLRLRDPVRGEMAVFRFAAHAAAALWSGHGVALRFRHMSIIPRNPDRASPRNGRNKKIPQTNGKLSLTRLTINNVCNTLIASRKS